VEPEVQTWITCDGSRPSCTSAIWEITGASCATCDVPIPYSLTSRGLEALSDA